MIQAVRVNDKVITHQRCRKTDDERFETARHKKRRKEPEKLN
jgi:hypothetical protein